MENSKKLIEELKTKAIELRLADDGVNLKWKAPKGVMTEEIKDSLKQHKLELLKLVEGPNTIQIRIGDKVPNRLFQADCLHILERMPENVVDLIVTDPPYGYEFMNKDWDKAVPPVEVWKECYRVLKPGGFAFVMSAPRQDVLSRMIENIQAAGFKTDFTSLYWTYASGFPKAHNIGKTIDKKLSAERKVIGERKQHDIRNNGYATKKSEFTEKIFGGPVTPEAKKYEGSYGGFQPKPAVEVILVAMKPLSEKGYTDQALANGKGITWLDDCRIPYADLNEHWSQSKGVQWSPERKWNVDCERQANTKGRFPANLLVSDDVLGKHSKFFSLDAWWEKLNASDLEEVVQRNLPFLIVPKASKREKNEGCERLDARWKAGKDFRPNHSQKAENGEDGNPYGRWGKIKNNHPTVKPKKLMSYLITLGSREGDVVLDPYCGSGTTCIAALELNRKSIGIEMSDKYYNIARHRIGYSLRESNRNQKKAC